MSRLSPIRSLFAATMLACFLNAAITAGDLTPFNFKSENGQAGFTLKNELQPAIAEIELQVLHLNTKVFEVRTPSNQMLVWPTRNSVPEPGQSTEFGFRLGMKDHDGVWLHSRGYFYRENGKLVFALSPGTEGLAGPSPLEFYRMLTEKSPGNAAGWLFYGITLTEKHANNFVFFTSPPPPPPAAPPPPSPGIVVVNLPPIPSVPQDNAEDLKRRAEEERQREADVAAMREEMSKAILPAIRKAYELTGDCQTKDAALLYLNRIADSLGQTQEARQWLLKRAESDCSSKESLAESYYTLAVEEWACAYKVSGKYKVKSEVDPFQFRQITNAADKRQFETCLSRSEAYIEKALTADPNYVDAMYYQSLLYRERQKVTADPVQHKRLGEEATKIANRASEIQRRR